MDGTITHDFWKSQNDKWQNEKDRLKIQLDEIDRLDREFYEKADIVLGFTDNAYMYFLKGNTAQINSYFYYDVFLSTFDKIIYNTICFLRYLK